jgi:hypothetical protein
MWWVPVKVLTGPVVPHPGLGVGVPGGDLHVAETDIRIQHGRDEGTTQHVRMHPRHHEPGHRAQLP